MNEFIVSTSSGNKVISSDNGQRGRSRKGGRYNDALQAHGVYHGHEDWGDAVFIPEDEALEQLTEIADFEGKTVDALVAEMEKFRQESHYAEPDSIGEWLDWKNSMGHTANPSAW